MTTPVVCVCGHGKEAHEHYRRGSDCSICGAVQCPRFRRSRRRASSVALRAVATPYGHRPQRTPDRARTLHAIL